MADREGQQLGNYRLVRKLGEGGFAEVYQAENIHIGTQAAIKLLFTRIGQDEIEDFKKEARTLANLMHPNIVRVLDFGLDNSIPYLVMDYAPGGTLRTRHPKGSRLPLPTVVEYVKQVASALQYAHDQKIVHRDIKPENMLIGRSGEILLSDFGIALISQSSRYQSTKDMAGTIAYMAPEQIEAHPRSASDQYSLAIVTYEWLCGTRPFHGSFTEIAIKHSVTPPTPLRDNLPTLPLGVEQVIMTALSKQPDERFKSVKAFATALEHASMSTPAKPSQPLVAPQSPPSPTVIAPQAKNTLSSEPLVPYIPVRLPYVPVPITSSSGRLTPVITTEPKSKSAKRISRRTVIIGATTIAVVGVGGSGVVWLTQTLFPSQGKLYLTYQGHTDALNSVAWSPDGQRIASDSNDNTV